MYIYMPNTKVFVISHASLTISFTDSAKMSIPVARSFPKVFNGGINRTVSYTDVVSRRRPFSRQRLDNFIAKFAGVPFFTAGSNVEREGEANSIAIIKPCPRMSRMCCPIDGSAFRAFNAFKSSPDLKNREWLRIRNQFERVSERTAR